MAYLAAGFDGTLYEGPWAQAWPFMGHGPVVENDAAQKVSVASGTRVVRVAVGAGAAAGVYVDLQDVVDITLPDATGSAKYWTIVRRTSGTGTAGNVTWLALGPTTTPVVAGTLIKNPGVTYDSPLAIYRITPGSTVPVLMQDLRVTLTQAAQGWGEWVEITKAAAVEDDSAHGHTWAYRLSTTAGRVEIRGAVKAADGSFSGGTSDTPIGSPLPAAARPNRRQYHVGAAAYDGSGPSWMARYFIDTDGQIHYFDPGNPAWMSFDGWVYDTN